MGRVMGRVMGQSRGQSLTQRRLRQLHDVDSLPPSLCMTKAAALALPVASRADLPGWLGKAAAGRVPSKCQGQKSRHVGTSESRHVCRVMDRVVGRHVGQSRGQSHAWSAWAESDMWACQSPDTCAESWTESWADMWDRAISEAWSASWAESRDGAWSRALRVQ